MYFNIPIPTDVREKGWLDDFKADCPEIVWKDAHHGGITIWTDPAQSWWVSIEVIEDKETLVRFTVQSTSVVSTIQAVIEPWFKTLFERLRILE